MLRRPLFILQQRTWNTKKTHSIALYYPTFIDVLKKNTCLSPMKKNKRIKQGVCSTEAILCISDNHTLFRSLLNTACNLYMLDVDYIGHN